MNGGNGDILDALVAGRFRPYLAAPPLQLPIRAVAIKPSLEGREADLVARAGLGGRLAVIADEVTFEVMGRRVARTLGAETVRLEAPKADIATVETLRETTRHADGLVAVGAGTLNDLVKHAAFLDGRPYAVFATAPSMNGYASSTASIEQDGYKHSLPSAPPRGLFFDLDILAAAPLRMIRAGLADALCRTTAEVDVLLSHHLLGTAYDETPYLIQREDEPRLLARAGALPEGDHEAMATLVRVLVLGGLGIVITGSSRSGSMGEHGISHYIDMLARPHPGSLHGEQVGVATITMSRLQDRILGMANLPLLRPTRIDEAALRRRFGRLAGDCLAGLRRKAIDAEAADRLNRRLRREWPAIRGELRRAMLPHDELEAVFRAAGVPIEPGAIGLDPAFYAEAVAHAHEIRDRFSMLDLAAHIDLLDDVVREEVP